MELSTDETADRSQPASGYTKPLKTDSPEPDSDLRSTRRMHQESNALVTEANVNRVDPRVLMHTDFENWLADGGSSIMLRRMDICGTMSLGTSGGWWVEFIEL